MTKARTLLAPAVLAVAMSWGAMAEEPAQTPPASPAAAPDTSASQSVDEDWLNTVWSQVDEMVQQKEYQLQETVTVAAVRGAEAEDAVLEKLYYRGGKRYPSQDKLQKAIETLKQAVADNPSGEDVPKQRFFIAQCYEKLGEVAQARTYYEQVARSHPDTRWATKSQERLAQLPVQP